MGRVDPHLIYGCECSPDVSLSLLHELEKVQLAYWRRELGINRRSVISPIFTETGVKPIRARRLILVLRYLEYLLERPSHTYAYNALWDNVQLYLSGCSKTWIGDLISAVSDFSKGTILIDIFEDLTAARVKYLIADVDKYSLFTLQKDINSLEKTYLLRGRREPDPDGTLHTRTSCFRHYLRITDGRHRKALTRVLLSSHSFASERLGWVDHARPAIPYPNRLCRLCESAVETPEHAILQCNNLGVILIRRRFWVRVRQDHPGLEAECTSLPSVRGFQRLLEEPSVVPLLGKLCFEIIEWFDQLPVRVPEY
jgi:hypothetical protein